MYMCKNVSYYLLVQMYILLETVTSQQTTYQFLLRLTHLGALPLLPLYNKRAIVVSFNHYPYHKCLKDMTFYNFKRQI